MSNAVVFDFDGVIHSYVSGWQGMTVITDPPVNGIREAIADIRRAGYEVIVVSARCAEPEGLKAVEEYLERNDIKVDRVCKEKPQAKVYIDDRALQFFDGRAVTLLGADSITTKRRDLEPLHEKKNLKQLTAEETELAMQLFALSAKGRNLMGEISALIDNEDFLR